MTLALKLTPLSLALALVITSLPATLSPAQAQVRLPSLGESVSEDVGVGAEKKLGDEIMRQVRRDADYIDDPLLLDYVQSIWTRLVAAARERGDIGADTDNVFAWEAFLVRDRSFNAFALPGGFVGVHLGLIAAAGTRDELASVLGHELSHVTQRHIARSISSSSRQSLVGMARTDPLRQGTDALQTWVADHPQDATAWSLLAQANTQQGLRLRAVRAEAEERAALGDLSGAIDRLRAGQRMARSGLQGGNDFVDASVIDARLRQIDALRRQLYADANRQPPRD